MEKRIKSRCVKITKKYNVSGINGYRRKAESGKNKNETKKLKKEEVEVNNENRKKEQRIKGKQV